MRYTNWDVLLFPEGSKVPLQEFKVNCYLTEDPDSPQRKMITPDELLAPIPTLTGFVPNLGPGHPFRISVHSWEPPVPTRATRAMAITQSRTVFFEARVLLDGLCVACTLLSQHSSWPQIIDTSSYSGKTGIFEPLRFPHFHKETITQSWWNACETMGRIKVIIAEGLAHGLIPTPFERTKNIVSFSFQHAPLHILEGAKVAWPSPGMWLQAPQQLYNFATPHDFSPRDADVHCHSPCGQGKYIDSNLTHADTSCGFSMAQPQSRIPGIKSEFKDSFLPSMTPFADPFVDDEKSGISGTSNGREGFEDQYAPDHSRSITPASKNQFDELVASLSARKDITGGLLAPANTRVSSAVNTPAEKSRASIEAEWKIFAHSHGFPRLVSASTRDAPPKASPEQLDVEMESGISEPWEDTIEPPGLKVQMSPTKEIKSRKEGMSGNVEHPLPKQRRSLAADLFRHSGKENSREASAENNPFVVGDSKRKRSTTVSNSSMPPALHDGGNCVSPMRKAMRTEWEEELSGDGFEDV